MEAFQEATAYVPLVAVATIVLWAIVRQRKSQLGAFPFIVAGLSYIPLIGIPFGAWRGRGESSQGEQEEGN